MPRYRIETLERHLVRVVYREVEAESEEAARALVLAGQAAYDSTETEEGDPKEELVEFVEVENLDPPAPLPPPVEHDFQVTVTVPAGMTVDKTLYLLRTVLELGWESLHDRGGDDGWRHELPLVFGPADGRPLPKDEVTDSVDFHAAPYHPGPQP